LKAWAISLGIGAVVGSVAILMMPRDNPTRKLAAKTAQKVENAASQISNRISQSSTKN
jgi:gas vesicle protein